MRSFGRAGRAVLGLACGGLLGLATACDDAQSQPKERTIQLTSTAFEHKAEIPTKYTCEGDDVSPPLTWTGVPKEAQTLSLIVDDPDAPDPEAPKTTWVHWVVYNMPASTSGLPEAVEQLPTGSSEGLNDFKRTSYGGPCPPIGRHRYFHKIYALDTRLDLTRPTKADVEEAMQGHILTRGQLIGTYEKKKNQD